MPLFKMAVEHGVHVFKVHEKAELTGVSSEELHQLVATASAAKRRTVVKFTSWWCLPSLLRPCGVCAPFPLACLCHLFLSPRCRSALMSSGEASQSGAPSAS